MEEKMKKERSNNMKKMRRHSTRNSKPTRPNMNFMKIQ